MGQLQIIEIAHVWRPPLTLAVLEHCRLRFYATTFSEQPDGAGWAQAPSGRYWRLEVPPSVYHALTAGDACGLLWHGEECLGAMDWDAREQEPNATAYHVEPQPADDPIREYEGDVTCASDGKAALLGRVDVDPDEEWWLIVPD